MLFTWDQKVESERHAENRRRFADIMEQERCRYDESIHKPSPRFKCDDAGNIVINNIDEDELF